MINTHVGIRALGCLVALAVTMGGCRRPPTREVSGVVLLPPGVSTAAISLRLRADAEDEWRTVAVDERGAFRADEVTYQYDAVVVAAEARASTLYLGLTRDDPALSPNLGLPEAQHHGRIVGTFTDWPATGRSAMVGFTTGRVVFSRDRYVSRFEPALSVNLDWSGGEVLTGDLYLLSYEREVVGDALQGTFFGFAALPGVAVKSGEDSHVAIELEEVETGQVSGELLFSDPQASVQLLTLATPAPGVVMAASASHGTRFVHRVPRHPSLPLLMRALGTSAGGYSLVQQRVSAGDVGVQVLAPAPPTQLVPADGAIVSGRTLTFAWQQPSPGALCQLALSASSPVEPPHELMVYSREQPFELTDLSLLAVGRGTSVTWQVAWLTAPRSVDEVASPLLAERVPEVWGFGLCRKQSFQVR